MAFDTAQQQLMQHAQQQFSKAPPGIERISLPQAQHRILAADILAPMAVPPFSNSAMDGIAINLDSTDLDQVLPMQQAVFAGQDPEPLQIGQACRIFTGAVLPHGADAVILQEDCEFAGDTVVVKPSAMPIRCQQHIRQVGEDIALGDRVLQQGAILTAAAIGLLSSLGLYEVEVYQALSVALVSSGDELVAAGPQSLRRGQIYNSNQPMLAAILQSSSCDVSVFHVNDTLHETKLLLSSLASDYDLIITIGGVSVGDADFIKTAIDQLGHLDFWKVAMKPGKPLAWGQVAATPILALPGNPVSAFASMQLFALPFIRRLQGRCESSKVLEHYPIALDQPLSPRREEFLRVRKIIHQQKIWLEPYAHQGSGVLSSVVHADGFARIANNRQTQSGDLVQFIAFA